MYSTSSSSMLSKMQVDPELSYQLNRVNTSKYLEVIAYLHATKAMNGAIQLLAEKFSIDDICCFLRYIKQSDVSEYKADIDILVCLFFSSPNIEKNIKKDTRISTGDTVCYKFWGIFDSLVYGEYFSVLEKFVDICINDENIFKAMFFNIKEFAVLFKYKNEQIASIKDKLITALCSNKNYLDENTCMPQYYLFDVPEQLFRSGHIEHAQAFFQFIKCDKVLLTIFTGIHTLDFWIPKFAKDNELPTLFIENISQMLKLIILAPELNCKIIKKETAILAALNNAGYSEEADLLRQINKSPEIINYKKVNKWQEEIQKSNDEAAKKTETPKKTNQNDNFEDELTYSEDENDEDIEYCEDEEDNEESSDNDNGLSK